MSVFYISRQPVICAIGKVFETYQCKLERYSTTLACGDTFDFYELL